MIKHKEINMIHNIENVKKMVNDLYLVYDKPSLRKALLSFGIDIKKLKEVCRDFYKINQLTLFHHKEMLSIKDDESHPAHFMTSTFHKVMKDLSNGRKVFDYYKHNI